MPLGPKELGDELPCRYGVMALSKFENLIRSSKLGDFSELKSTPRAFSSPNETVSKNILSFMSGIPWKLLLVNSKVLFLMIEAHSLCDRPKDVSSGNTKK